MDPLTDDPLEMS